MKRKLPEYTAANKKGIFWEPVAKVAAEKTRGLALLFQVSLRWTDIQCRGGKIEECRAEWWRDRR